jgi:hypothetical protein
VVEVSVVEVSVVEVSGLFFEESSPQALVVRANGRMVVLSRSRVRMKDSPNEVNDRICTTRMMQP